MSWGGGQGGGLAYRLITGSSKPTNPKDNDIWINTTTPITGVSTYKEQVTSYAEEGHVQIIAEFDSDTPSATSKTLYNYNAKHQSVINTQIIKIKFICQRIEGKWVRLDSWKYINGTWGHILTNPIPAFNVKVNGVDAAKGDVYQLYNTDTGEVCNQTDYVPNWKIKFFKSCAITFTELNDISQVGLDVFCCGGGGNGGRGTNTATTGGAGGGGGGGYTKTAIVRQITKGSSYPIVVAGTAGTSSAFSISADGGKAGQQRANTAAGGAGGSGGGDQSNAGGTDGGKGGGSLGGAGQGYSTREFQEASGTLYSTGGAGGRLTSNVTKPANTGNGGDGAAHGYSNNYGIGGSGIVVIRNSRTPLEE